MLDQDALQTELEKIRKRIDEFAEKVARIDGYIKLAIGVALVFGIGGAWGWQVVSSVRGEINAVRDQLNDVKKEAEEVGKKATALSSTFDALEQKQIPELGKKFQELQLNTVTTNKQAEVIAAEMREKAAVEVGRLFAESRAAGDLLEQNRREAEAAMSAGAKSTLADFRQETRAAVDEIERTRAQGLAEVQKGIQETMRGATASPAWKDCAIEPVGLERTHASKEGPWCPKGKFIVQLNFDAKRFATEVFVREVVCCAPTFEQ